MASWLKKAEGLLEAVDQVASKIAVGETDEGNVQDTHSKQESHSSPDASSDQDSTSAVPGTSYLHLNSSSILTTQKVNSKQKLRAVPLNPSPQKTATKTARKSRTTKTERVVKSRQISVGSDKEEAGGKLVGENEEAGGKLKTGLGIRGGSEMKKEVKKAIAEAIGEAEGGPVSDSMDRESRLVQLCEQLRKRLEESKVENRQLEDLLHKSDSRARGNAGDVEHLKLDLENITEEATRKEATLQAGVVAKDLELSKLRNELTASSRWASELETQVSALKETNQQLLEENRMNEGRLMEALRDQLSEAEGKLEQERLARASVLKSTAEREAELQQELADSAAALSKMQRHLDDRSSRVNDLEGTVSSLVSQVTELSGQLKIAKLNGAIASGSAPPPEELSSKIEGLECELAESKVACSDALSEKQTAESKCMEMTREIESLRQDLDETRAQVNSGAEQRLHEMTELLYLKQAQLERLTTEKASQQLSMEREIRTLNDQIQTSKRTPPTQGGSSFASDTVIPMDALGETFYKLANHKRVGKAVRKGAQIVDNTAAKFVHILRQYPLWRLFALMYLVFIHLYCYVLLSKLQKKVVLATESGGVIEKH